MPGFIRFTLAACVAVACVTSICKADDKDDIKASGKAFAEAMQKGDGAEAHKHLYADENSKKFVDTIIDLTVSRKKLVDAAEAKFGEEGKNIAGPSAGPKSPGEMLHDLDEAQVEVHGDTAVVTPKTGQPVNFKKDQGEWKIDMSQLANNPQMAQAMPILSKMAPAMSELAGEINDGKYKTIEEAKMAFRLKLAAAMGFPGGGFPRGPRPGQP